MISVLAQLQPDASTLSHNHETEQRGPDMHCPRLPAQASGSKNFHRASCLRRTEQDGACIPYNCQTGHDLRVSLKLPVYSQPGPTQAEIDRDKRLEQVRAMRNERRRKQRALLNEMARRGMVLKTWGVPA